MNLIHPSIKEISFKRDPSDRWPAATLPTFDSVCRCLSFSFVVDLLQLIFCLAVPAADYRHRRILAIRELPPGKDALCLCVQSDRQPTTAIRLLTLQYVIRHAPEDD